MRKQKGSLDLGVVGGLISIVLILAAAWGWVANIVAIAHADFSDITGLLVLRIVGIFVAPLGAILGFC